MNNNAFTQPHSDRYRITIKGVMDEEFIRDYCAPGFTLTYRGGKTTLSNISTDQAGIVGLIRQLHNLGVTVLAVELQSEMEGTE